MGPMYCSALKWKSQQTEDVNLANHLRSYASTATSSIDPPVHTEAGQEIDAIDISDEKAKHPHKKDITAHALLRPRPTQTTLLRNSRIGTLWWDWKRMAFHYFLYNSWDTPLAQARETRCSKKWNLMIHLRDAAHKKNITAHALLSPRRTRPTP